MSAEATANAEPVPICSSCFGKLSLDETGATPCKLISCFFCGEGAKDGFMVGQAVLDAATKALPKQETPAVAPEVSPAQSLHQLAIDYVKLNEYRETLRAQLQQADALRETALGMFEANGIDTESDKFYAFVDRLADGDGYGFAVAFLAAQASPLVTEVVAVSQAKPETAKPIEDHSSSRRIMYKGKFYVWYPLLDKKPEDLPKMSLREQILSVLCVLDNTPMLTSSIIDGTRMINPEVHGPSIDAMASKMRSEGVLVDKGRNPDGKLLQSIDDTLWEKVFHPNRDYTLPATMPAPVTDDEEPEPVGLPVVETSSISHEKAILQVFQKNQNKPMTTPDIIANVQKIIPGAKPRSVETACSDMVSKGSVVNLGIRGQVLLRSLSEPMWQQLQAQS